MIGRVLVAAIHLTAISACALAADDAGIVKNLKGQASIERAGISRDAMIGDAIQQGDRIRVRGDSSVGISMRDETLMSLGPNSALVIDNFSYNPATRDGQVETTFLKGTLRYVTGLIGRANPRAIRLATPTATVGIRGTDFIVDASDE